jgi:hypothetical protein
MFISREDGLRSGRRGGARTRWDSAEPSNSGNTRWVVLAGTAAVGAMLRALSQGESVELCRAPHGFHLRCATVQEFLETFTRGNTFAKTQTVDSGIAVSDSLGYVGHKDIAGPLPVCVLLLPRPRTIAASG